jgi:formylglycine-generating enzyme required for sulfatase activity
VGPGERVPDQPEHRADREGGDLSPSRSRREVLIGAWSLVFLVAVGSALYYRIYRQPRPIDPMELAGGDAIMGPLGMRMRFVPPGDYTLGAVNTQSESASLRPATLTRGVWLTETEVTQRRWEMLVRRQPSKNAGCANCPVERVNWFEAAEFANRVSEYQGLERCYGLLNPQGTLGTGDEKDETPWFSPEKSNVLRFKDVTFVGLECLGYRLPTEAEWEVAVRAGGEYPQGRQALARIAWYDEISSGITGGTSHPVATKQPNRWGFYDLLGNVAEWNQNWRGELFDDPVQDPIGPETGRGRLCRGGSWESRDRQLGPSYRGASDPQFRHEGLGFRLARTQRPRLPGRG